MTDLTLIDRLKAAQALPDQIDTFAELQAWVAEIDSVLIAAIAALSSPPSLDLRTAIKKEDTRVGDSQYAAPLATAGENQPSPIES